MPTSMMHGLAGADLRAHRKAAALTQTQLANLAGCRRGAVAYWERKGVPDVRFGLVDRLARIVGMYDYEASMRARARARWGVTSGVAPGVRNHDALSVKLATLDAQILAQEIGRHERDVLRQAEWQARRRAEREAQRARREPARCGALTRKETACRHVVEPGRTRCKFHGGKSTGPRTPEGRARIAEAQRKRWAVWRLGPAARPSKLTDS